jgi:thioredoxin-related protein
MKKIISCIALAIAIITLQSNTPPTPLPIGSKLPKQDLAMETVSGKPISMREAVGEKGLLVMFSCNECPFVIKYQQRTLQIANVAKGLGYGVILLNSNESLRNDGDGLEDMIKYAKSQDYNFPYALDKNSTLADAFGASRTPECFLFNKELKLVYHGAIDDNASDEQEVSRRHLETALNEDASGQEVSVKETKSIGCGIKRLKM